MYAWYEGAEICYAYLADVSAVDDGRHAPNFASSRWFSRGWTLQELLAPDRVVFYDSQWIDLGDKISLGTELRQATGIPAPFLRRERSILTASIAQRMSWAARRETTREEDIAYCLIVLFGVNMPMLYGEGSRAFIRLQEEIMKGSDDKTLFAWKGDIRRAINLCGLLAESPWDFRDSGSIVPFEIYSAGAQLSSMKQSPYSVTNRGLNIGFHMDVLNDEDVPSFVALLECAKEEDAYYLAIVLVPTGESPQHFARARSHEFVVLNDYFIGKDTWRDIYVRQSPGNAVAVNKPYHRVRFEGVDFDYNGYRHTWRLGNAVEYGCHCNGRNHPKPSWRCDEAVLVAKKRGAVSMLALSLHPDGGHAIVVLIGCDYKWRLAFDVEQLGSSSAEDEEYWAGRSDRPSCELERIWQRAASTFTPHPPSVRMAQLDRWDIEVAVYYGINVDDVIHFRIQWRLKEGQPRGVSKSEEPVGDNHSTRRRQQEDGMSERSPEPKESMQSARQIDDETSPDTTHAGRSTNSGAVLAVQVQRDADSGIVRPSLMHRAGRSFRGVLKSPQLLSKRSSGTKAAGAMLL